MKKIIAIIFSIVVMLPLVACNATDEKDKVEENIVVSTEQKVEVLELKIGTIGVSEQPAQIIAKGLREKGYKTEVIVFDSVNIPATALHNKEINFVMANSLPWMETFIDNTKGADFTMLEPYFYVSPSGIYSSKWSSLEELPDGATFVISNDPSNREFALKVLEEAGLIKLGEKKDAFYSQLDIETNIKNIEFSETEVTSTARALADVDATVSTAIVAKNTGAVDPNSYLYRAKTANPISPFVNTEDLNQPWVSDIIDIISSDETKKDFNEIIQGSFILWDEYQESIK